MPPVKQHDVEISADLHTGLGWLPPVPPLVPVPAKFWLNPAGARVCWVTDKSETGWGTGTPSKNVFINGKKAIMRGHDIGFFIPHLPIPGMNAAGSGTDLLMWLTISLSMAKFTLGAGSVFVNGKPMAVGPWPVIICGQPIPWPTGGVESWCDVKAGVSAADWVTAGIEYAIDVAIALIMNKIFGKSPGKATAEKRGAKIMAQRTGKRLVGKLAAKRFAKTVGARIGGRATGYGVAHLGKVFGSSGSGPVYDFSNHLANLMVHGEWKSDRPEGGEGARGKNAEEAFADYMNSERERDLSPEGTRTAGMDMPAAASAQAGVLADIMGMVLVGEDMMRPELRSLARTPLNPGRPVLRRAVSEAFREVPEMGDERLKEEGYGELSRADLDELTQVDVASELDDGALRETLRAAFRGPVRSLLEKGILYNELGPAAFKADLSQIGIPEPLWEFVSAGPG
jgi:hypothetical protein